MDIQELERGFQRGRARGFGLIARLTGLPVKIVIPYLERADKDAPRILQLFPDFVAVADLLTCCLRSIDGEDLYNRAVEELMFLFLAGTGDMLNVYEQNDGDVIARCEQLQVLNGLYELRGRMLIAKRFTSVDVLARSERDLLVGFGNPYVMHGRQVPPELLMLLSADERAALENERQQAVRSEDAPDLRWRSSPKRLQK
jgi:hypothetical protein